MDQSIIETRASAIMRPVANQVVAGAGLAILRGPVGIGKTFALERMVAELSETGVSVTLVTVNPSIDGNINAFLKAILGPHSEDPGSAADAAEIVWQMLRGYPFDKWGRKTLLVVDEAQGLAARVLETVRGLWDRGTLARQGARSAPAFGCMLVGNSTFLNKGGTVRRANFAPLIDRLSADVSLPTPNRAECARYAATVFPDDAAMQDELIGAGVARRSFRVMDVAARQARVLAGDGKCTIDHLLAAIKGMGIK